MSVIDKEITSIILTRIYPMVETSLSKGNAKLKACIGRFITSRSKSIYDNGPNDRIYFGAEDVKDFFQSMGFTEKDIINHLQHAYFWDINFSPIAVKDPFTVTMMMVIRYFHLKKMKKELELATIYLLFSGKFYASIHSGSFPKAPPSQHRAVMDYVINYQLTNKFDIKKEGSLFGAVRQLGITWLDSYEERFQKPTDEDVAYLIQQLHNRLKSLIINVAQEYYKAYENKDYLNYESDNLSDDSDGYRLTDNDSLISTRFTENTMEYLTNSSVNYSFCKMCSDVNVKTDELMDIMSSIIHDSNYLHQIRDVLNIMITDYVRRHPEQKNVASISFLSYTIKAKPNTKDKDLLKMKQIIESWLDESSPNYRRRKSREATRNSYYKAIVEYFALVINKANN